MSKRVKKYLRLALPVIIVGGMVYGVMKYVNGEELFEALQQFNYSYAPIMLAASTIYLLVISWRFVILLRPLSDIRWQTPFKSFIASQPGLLIPGGLALRAGILNQAGVPLGKGSIPVLLSSVLDQTTFFSISLIAALWFPPARTPVLITLAGLAAVTFALSFATTRRYVVRAIDWVVRTLHIEEQWQQFKIDLPKTLNWQMLAYTLALTLVSIVFTVIVLHLDVEGLGQSVPYHALLLAFVLPTMLGRMMPLIPGGFGIIEASMVGVLVSVAALSTNTATAVVIIFRIATILFQALLGALVYFFFWRGSEESKQGNAQSSPAS